jgi:hypothetical protein
MIGGVVSGSSLGRIVNKYYPAKSNEMHIALTIGFGVVFVLFVSIALIPLRTQGYPYLLPIILYSACSCLTIFKVMSGWKTDNTEDSKKIKEIRPPVEVLEDNQSKMMVTTAFETKIVLQFPAKFIDELGQERVVEQEWVFNELLKSGKIIDSTLLFDNSSNTWKQAVKFKIH